MNLEIEMKLYILLFMLISIGNHMDESAIWEKIAGNRKNARGEAECYLNCCNCNYFPKSHVITLLTFTAQVVTTVQFKVDPVQFKIDPVQFQVTPCNFK